MRIFIFSFLLLSVTSVFSQSQIPNSAVNQILQQEYVGKFPRGNNSFKKKSRTCDISFSFKNNQLFLNYRLGTKKGSTGSIMLNNGLKSIVSLIDPVIGKSESITFVNKSEKMLIKMDIAKGMSGSQIFYGLSWVSFTDYDGEEISSCEYMSSDTNI